MLRKSVCILIAASFAASPSFAEEIALPSKNVKVTTSTQSGFGSPNWTGGYAGVQLGYGDIDTNVAGVQGDDIIGGVIAGYDHDLGDWVVGAGIDYDFASINLGGAATLDNILRLKLRGGYKFGDGLLYGTAGYAHAYTDTFGNDDGYFVGAGYEHLLSPSFGLSGELLYHEFDNLNGSGVNVDATTFQVRATFRF